MNELKEKNKNAILSYPDIEKDSAESLSPIEYVIKPKRSIKKKVIISSISTFSVLIALFGIVTFANLTSNNIFSNIYIDGIEVSGLSKDEAIKKLETEKNVINNSKLKVICENINSEISNNDISGISNIEDAVNTAYNIGRYNNIFNNNFNMITSFFSKSNITSEYKYDSEKFAGFIENINSQLEKPVQSGYSITDDNLIITKGKPGVVINKDDASNKIISALQTNSTTDVKIDVDVVVPEEINLTEIKEKIYKEPKDASYKKDPFEVIPHQIGVDFKISLEDASKLLAEANNECTIPLAYTTPKVTTNNIGSEAFPNLLSSFQTTYIQSKVNRTTNLKVASNSINGLIIMPGETFSYNKALGPRTVSNGYKMAGMYSGGEVVDGLGGGICQISSNLYNIVLLANLEIVERHNHQFLPGYVGAGKDATVVWGALDFKFKNTRNYPIKIESSVGNGYVYMKLYGTKENNDYEVVISTTVNSTIYPTTVYENTTTLNEGATKVKDSGQNGCKSVTYKILKKNGKEVSRTQLSSDTYSAMKKVVLRGTKKTTPVAPPTNNENNTNTNTNNNSNNLNTNTGTNTNTETGTNNSGADVTVTVD